MTDERDIDVLRGDIEVTRQRIATEIEAIGERLTPEHAKEVAKEKLVEAKDRAIENVKTSARRIASAAGDTPANLGSAIRENPIPTMMVCAGTGWLLYKAFNRARTSSSDRSFEAGSFRRTPSLDAGTDVGTYETGWEPFEQDVEGSGRMARAKDRIAHAASGVRERMGSARERARDAAIVTKERASRVASAGREKARLAAAKTQDAYGTNPLLFGAGAIALGFGLAMMLPKTERESELLGERRDRVLQRAKSAALEVKDKAVEAAKEGMRSATEKTLP